MLYIILEEFMNKKQDLQKAKELYNQVIERYSGTDGASSANKRLRNLE